VRTLVRIARLLIDTGNLKTLVRGRHAGLGLKR
jgi:hypothetical protein